jgi:antibiotic biosynthesis monooxygenase (ABM) superfamily enzyme
MRRLVLERWKLAVLIWLAIYPSLTLLLWLVGPKIGSWPLPMRTLALTAVLVPLMVFVLIPALQRLLAPWLRPMPPKGHRELSDQGTGHTRSVGS